MQIITVKPENNEQRLDKFLCQIFDISFNLAQKIIREKKVKLNGKKVDPAFKISAEDEIEIFANLNARTLKIVKKPLISSEKIKNFLNHVIYQDENLVAINKPSGLASQGGSGIEISVDDLLIAFNKNGAKAQLVHRLDKDTSGVLLIALNKKTAEFLTQSFKEKTIKKTYLALVAGVPKKNEGVINIALQKKLVGKNEKVYPSLDGKEAITNFKLLKSFGNCALLKLEPLTGRTHQIRVHCKELGHPIINDIKYGGLAVKSKNFKFMCLHALEIKIPNYQIQGRDLTISTPYPQFAV